MSEPVKADATAPMPPPPAAAAADVKSDTTIITIPPLPQQQSHAPSQTTIIEQLPPVTQSHQPMTIQHIPIQNQSGMQMNIPLNGQGNPGMQMHNIQFAMSQMNGMQGDARDAGNAGHADDGWDADDNIQ